MNLTLNPSLRKSRQENLLGVRVDFVDYDEVIRQILAWRKNSQRKYIVLCNPHTVCEAHRSRALLNTLRESALNLPDGVGTTIAAQILKIPHFGRVSGPTLMLRVCGAVSDPPLRHFFVGGRPGVGEALAQNLTMRNPQLQVAGIDSPAFNDSSDREASRVLKKINASRADIVWVGLGSPKQELWMSRHREHLAATALIGIGAAFDFHAGTVPWAPRWVRKAGLEWAFRLLIEPRRLWRRNVDSPAFLARVISQRLFGSAGAE